MKKWVISWKQWNILRSALLIKGVSGTTKNETKEQKGGFLDMLLGTLSASLLWILLKCKSTTRGDEGKIIAGQGF